MTRALKIRQRVMWTTDRPWLYRVEDPLQRLLCVVFGHDPIRDECGLPEHDYCGWCLKPTPNQWHCDDSRRLT